MKINMNVNLRQGGRSAVKMSIEDLQDKIAEAVEKYNIPYDADDLYRVIPELMYDVPTINKDLKVNMNIENMEADFEMTSSGVPYLFIEAASDCSPWMVFMIYYDGKNLRAYIPTLGNPYNRKNKSMLWEDTEADIKFLKAELGQEGLREAAKESRSDWYDEYGDEDYEDDDWSDEDDNDEDYDDEDFFCEIIHTLQYDRRSVIKDFETRLTVK